MCLLCLLIRFNRLQATLLKYSTFCYKSQKQMLLFTFKTIKQRSEYPEEYLCQICIYNGACTNFIKLTYFFVNYFDIKTPQQEELTTGVILATIPRILYSRARESTNHHLFSTSCYIDGDPEVQIDFQVSAFFQGIPSLIDLH